MDAILAPLERFHDALSWFVAAPELRLLYLRASDSLRAPLLARPLEQLIQITAS